MIPLLFHLRGSESDGGGLQGEHISLWERMCYCCHHVVFCGLRMASWRACAFRMEYSYCEKNQVRYGMPVYPRIEYGTVV